MDCFLFSFHCRRLVEHPGGKQRQGLLLFMFGASIPLDVDYSWSRLLTGSNQTWNPWRPCQDPFGRVGHSMRIAGASHNGLWSLEQTWSSLRGIWLRNGSFQMTLISHGHLKQDAHRRPFVSSHLVEQAAFSCEPLTRHLQQWTLEWFGVQRHHPRGQEGIWPLLPKESASSQACQLLQLIC